MNNLVLENYKHIHFVGIGGVSMHSLAMYCKDLGMLVTGSDLCKNKYIDNCKDYGITTYLKHKRKNVHGADLVVHSAAINESNIEIIEARARGIKVVDRAELLASICKRFKCVIGISGSHGKSTTSAMIYHILRESGKRVSCHIGADINNSRLNPTDDYLVLECCEYNKSFLKFNCDIGVVLNIDNDHLDCYQNMYNLRNAFRTFIKHCTTRLVLDNASTKCVKSKARRIKSPKVITDNKFIYNDRKYVLNNVYGVHNITNATMAISVCMEVGLSYTKIYKALKTFKAVGRRCQLIGKYNTMDVILDYAHHPTEIQALYTSLQAKYKNICLIFQPHTYSRTKILLYDFVKLFVDKSNIIIYKEYPARERENQGYSANRLSKCIDNAVYCGSYHSLKKQLLDKEIMEGGCIVFVGAGDIDNIALKLVQEYGIANWCNAIFISIKLYIKVEYKLKYLTYNNLWYILIILEVGAKWVI